MKRLGVYACIAILTISFFGNFEAPKIANAQATPPTTTAGSYDYFLNRGLENFTITTAALNQVRSTTVSQPSSPEQLALISQIDENIGLIAAAQAAYTQSFSSNRQNSISPVETQIAAIRATRSTYGSRLLTISNAARTSPYTSRIMRMFTDRLDGNASLMTEALQVQRNIIQPGSAEALALGNAAPIAVAGNTASNVVVAAQDNRCFNFTSFSVANCVTAFVTWLIKNTLLEIAGFLLWLAANMFNYSVQIGILQFAQWAPDTLYPMWLIVRQVLSLIIVFIGLYLGFMYILGKDEKFARYVPFVVMFALFVNFSYPIARTAIDVSNIVSLNIYASAVGNNAIASSDPNNTAGAIIMGRLGLAGLATSATAAGVNGAGGIIGSINSIPGALLVVVFVLYAAYIFFMITGIIVMRTAALVFLTIASPFLLIDSVLPFLGEKAMQVRKIFFEQLIVGPIFMIMLAITMRMLSIFSTSGALSQNGLGNLASNSQSTVVTFFNVVMMLIMLHIMITVTKKTAGTLGEYATGAMGKVGGVGLGVATGGAGLLARGTVGKLAAKARDSGWMTNNQDSFLGRRAYDMSNSLAKSSFDLRNSKVVAGKMSKLGMGMGMGRTMGYDQAKDARVKDAVDRGKNIGIHQQNVYDAEGKLIYKKGDRDTSPEADAARKRYLENGGGSIFTSKDEKKTIAYTLDKTLNIEKKTKYDEALSKYKGFDEDEKDEKGLNAREELMKKLKSEDPESFAKLEKYKNKDAEEKQEKKDDKKMRQEAIESNKSLAESNKALASALDGGQSQSTAPKVATYAQYSQPTMVNGAAQAIPNPVAQQQTTNLVTKIQGQGKLEKQASDIENIQTESFEERAAAKRKAALARNAAEADAEMAENTKNADEAKRKAESAGGPTAPTTPPVPPRPSGPSTTAANQTPFDPSNAGGNKEPLAA